MSYRASTYILVLAATYPPLKAALEAVIGGKLTSDSLEKYHESLIHGQMLYALEKIVYVHSINYNSINLDLQKINEIVDRISEVNYGDLNDEQKNRLPNLAKEVDEASYHIREEVYPKLVEEKKGLSEILSTELEKASSYLQNLDKIMDAALADVNEQFSLELSWTEGKGIWTFEQLHAWLERNDQLDKNIKEKIRGLESDDTISLLRAVIMMEAMTVVFENAAMGGNRDKQDQASKIISHIESIDLDTANYDISEQQEGIMVSDMQKTTDKIQSLYEELFSYPAEEKELDDDEIKDLDRLSKADQIFTTVDKAVKD